IALVRHRKAPISGIVIDLEKHGFAGALFFSDPPQISSPRGRIWPLGPGRAAWFVERGAATRTPAAPTIPVATIAWSVAEPLLAAKGKSGLPAAPSVIGGQPGGQLELDIQMNDSPKPVFNVIATVDGMEKPKRRI